MNIALVFDGLQVGGIEKVGAAYARILVELGHTVTIISLRPNLREFEHEFPDECKIERLSFPLKLVPEAYSNLIQGNGYLRLLAYPFVYGAVSAADALYKLVCRTRPVFRQKYDLAVAFSGHLRDLTFVASGFVKAKHTMCWLHGALFQYLAISHSYYNLYKKIKNLVVLSDEAQRETLASFRSDPGYRIHKLYNPIDINARPTDDTLVQDLRKKYGRFLIMVSRFDYPAKDHYTVVDALKILRSEYKDDLNLLLLGDGGDRAGVEAYVKSLGKDTASHVHFLGTRYDTQNFYTAAHLLVHASVSGEGLPTIMLEAMAFQLPMVVTDVKVGPREIVKNSEYGVLCNVQDPIDMAAKIHQLCTDDALYRHYQEKCTKRLPDFMPETIKQQLEQILSEFA